MNLIKRWFTERWLKSRGWTISGCYPWPRGHPGHQYSVCSHPKEIGVGGIEWAVEMETKRTADEGGEPCQS